MLLLKNIFALPLLSCCAAPILASQGHLTEKAHTDEEVMMHDALKKTVHEKFGLVLPSDIMDLLLLHIQQPDVTFRLVSVVSKSFGDAGRYHCDPAYNQTHKVIMRSMRQANKQRIMLHVAYMSTASFEEVVVDAQKEFGYYESQEITIPRQITARIPLLLGMTYADYAALVIHQYLGMHEYTLGDWRPGVLYTRIVPSLSACQNYARPRYQDELKIIGTGLLKTAPYCFVQQVGILGWRRYHAQREQLMHWHLATRLFIVTLNDISVAVLTIFIAVNILPRIFKIGAVKRFFKDPRCPLDPIPAMSLAAHLIHVLLAYLKIGIVELTMICAFQLISCVELIHKNGMLWLDDFFVFGHRKIY